MCACKEKEELHLHNCLVYVFMQAKKSIQNVSNKTFYQNDKENLNLKTVTVPIPIF